MGELISIGNAGLGADIDLTGAWVTRFGSSEFDVLHQRFTNEEGRLRGGMHICSPYFGKAAMPAHGFSRLLEWSVSQMTADSIILALDHNGLQQTLGYFISPNSFLTVLKIRNKDAEDVIVAPGFHPYFFRPKGFSDLEVDSPRLSETSRADMHGSSLTELELRSGHSVKVLARGMQEVIEWTDMPDDYICVEPTAASGSIDLRHKGVVKLEGHEEAIYCLDITVLNPVDNQPTC